MMRRARTAGAVAAGIGAMVIVGTVAAQQGDKGPQTGAEPEAEPPAGTAGEPAGEEGGAMAKEISAQLVEGRMLPVDIDVRKLSNGLTVALVKFDSPGLASYYTAMRVGSRDEVEQGHSGFAHLFEHMMFRGTKKLPGSLYDQRVQSLGADSSAWTWNDQTVYFFVAPSKALPEVISMEAERFMNLTYAEPEFKTESGAVLGEYNKNFSDPINQMEEDLMNLAFEKSTYKHTTMGFFPDIKAMPSMYRYSLEFFEKHYVPAKAVIFVTGDFDKDAVMKDISKHYGLWTKPGTEVVVPAEPQQKGERASHRAWKSEVLPQMLVGYKAPAYDNSNVDFAALAVLGEMVFGKTSPVYRKLVLEDQAVEEVEFWDWPHRDPCLWIYYMRMKNEDFAGAQAQVDALIADIAAGKVTQERLDAVKSRYRYGFVLALETPRSIGNQLSFYSSLDGDPASAEKFLQRVDEVTLEDLKRMASTWLVKSGRTTVTLSFAGAKGGTP